MTGPTWEQDRNARKGSAVIRRPGLPDITVPLGEPDEPYLEVMDRVKEMVSDWGCELVDWNPGWKITQYDKGCLWNVAEIPHWAMMTILESWEASE